MKINGCSTCLDFMFVLSTRSNPGLSTVELEEDLEIRKNLTSYALELINKDREKYHLSPVNLSSNKAAQVHSDDLINIRSPHASHWTSDGFKPYMKFTVYNGTGYVQQNVALSTFNNDSINKCREDSYQCTIMQNPNRQIFELTKQMVYNDTRCCMDLHRQNILDQYHTDVSIGISYDKYRFVLVQNFENNYVNFTKPLKEKDTYVNIEGRIEQNFEIETIGVYYDSLPSPLKYEESSNLNSYELGNLIGLVVKPPPIFAHYQRPINKTLIEADDWSNANGLVKIGFDLSQVMKLDGVYTIVIYLTDKDNNQRLPAASYSIFKRGHS